MTRRTMFWMRAVVVTACSSLVAACAPSGSLPSPSLAISGGAHVLGAASAHAAGRWLASEKPRPQAQLMFRMSVNGNGTTFEDSAGIRQVSTANAFRQSSSVCLQSGGRSVQMICGGSGDPPAQPTPNPTPAATPAPNLVPVPSNLITPDNHVIEVDYYSTTTGPNLWVYFDDGTVDVGSLVENQLIVYHPVTMSGVWAMDIVDAVDHNVYMTATKIGTVSQSVSRAAASSQRQTREVDCTVVEFFAPILGGFIGRIIGEEVGGDIGGGVGMLLGPEGALIGAIGGAVAGWKYGAAVGYTMGFLIAHYGCKAINDAIKPTNPNQGSGGTGIGGSGPPGQILDSDVCHSDNPPPECSRRQAGPGDPIRW